MNWDGRLFVRILLYFFLAGTTIVGCTFMSASQMKEIQQNIDRLREAQSKLTENPQDRQALALILNLLKDRNGINRSNAAAVLGEVGEKIGGTIKDEAVPALIQLLRSPDLFDKKSAACALAKFGQYAKDAMPILRENLIPANGGIAWCSAEALGAMGEIAKDAVADLVRVTRESQAESVGDGPDMCQYAVQALGSIGRFARQAVSDLEALLGHNNPYLRIRAAVSLIRIDPGNQKALGALKALLNDAEVNIKQKTIWSLEDIGFASDPAKELIKAALKDNDESVRNAARRLLQLLENR